MSAVSTLTTITGLAEVSVFNFGKTHLQCSSI